MIIFLAMWEMPLYKYMKGRLDRVIEITNCNRMDG